MTQRDASGRFVRATPAEKVAAHVEKVNALHAPERWHHHPTKEPVFGTWKDAQWQWGETPRSQPLEYDDEPWPVWLWLGIGTVVLVLGVAVWVMTH